MATVDFLYLNNVQIPQILSPLIFMTAILCILMSERNISRDPFSFCTLSYYSGQIHHVSGHSGTGSLYHEPLELHGSKLKSFSPRQERKTKKMTTHKREKKIGI